MTKLLYTKEKKNTLFEFTRYRHSAYDYDFGRVEGGGDVNMNYQFWNGQPRHSTAMIYFDSFESRLNGQDFDTLLNLPKIFVNIISDDAKQAELAQKKPASRSKKNSEYLMNELKDKGKEHVCNYIQSKLKTLGHQEKSMDKIEKHTIFQFLFNQIDLTMINLNSEPFLHAHVENLRSKIHSIGKISSTYSVSFQTINIVKPRATDERLKYNLSRRVELEREANGLPDEAFDYQHGQSGDDVLRVMFDNSSNEQVRVDVRGSPTPQEKTRKSETTQLKNPWKKGAFILEQTVYNIEVESSKKAAEMGVDPSWSVVSSLEIITKPFEVKVDLQIIKQVREYLLIREWNKIYKTILEKDINDQQPLFIENNGVFFKKREESIQAVKQELANEQSEENKKKAQDQALIVPTYYNRISLKETSLMVTFNTDNKLLRLNKMKLNMNTFAKERKFYTRTNLIDKLIRFVKNSAVKGLASHTLLCFGSDSKKDEDLVRARHGKDNLKMILGGDY